MNAYKKLKQRARKGFSLVELVIVIIIIAILAVAVFAGGSAAIKKSQVSRTVSDLHNFSVAIEAAMNETPQVANMNTKDQFDDIINTVNKNLAADYALTELATDVVGNTVTKQSEADGNYVIYTSAKLDSWDNPYYVVFDATERHDDGISEFYITVVSAGPNAQTTISYEVGDDVKGIEADDVFLLVQYSDGDVSAVTYNVDDNDTVLQNGDDAAVELKVTLKGVAADKAEQAQYIGTVVNGDGRDSLCPVNFLPTAQR